MIQESLIETDNQGERLLRAELAGVNDGGSNY